MASSAENPPPTERFCIGHRLPALPAPGPGLFNLYFKCIRCCDEYMNSGLDAARTASPAAINVLCYRARPAIVIEWIFRNPAHGLEVP